MSDTTLSTHTFTIPTPDVLSGPLKTVMAVVNKSNPLEILKGVLVEIGPKGCTLTGTDLEQTVKVRVTEIRSGQDGSGQGGAGDVAGDDGSTGEVFAFVMFPRTIDMIHRLPDMPIEFEFSPSDNILQIHYGFSEQKHGTLPAKDYPRESGVEGYSFSVVGVDWKRVAFAVDPKEVRAHFTGVYMDLANSKLVGTDTRRMVVLDVGDAIQGGVKDSFLDNGSNGIIIPLKAVNFINQLMSSGAFVTVGDGGQKIKVVAGDANKDASAGDVTLYSRLIAGRYPNYGIIVDPHQGDKATTGIVVNVDELTEAVERAGFMGKDEILRFGFRGEGGRSESGGVGVIEILSQGIEGKVREVVSCELQGDDLIAGFNWRFLLDCLKHAEADRVFWGLHGQHSPSIFRGVGEDGDKVERWLGLLVPTVVAG